MNKMIELTEHEKERKIEELERKIQDQEEEIGSLNVKISHHIADNFNLKKCLGNHKLKGKSTMTKEKIAKIEKIAKRRSTCYDDTLGKVVAEEAMVIIKELQERNNLAEDMLQSNHNRITELKSEVEELQEEILKLQDRDHGSWESEREKK